MSLVEDVRVISRTSPSTCRKIRYSSRSDTLVLQVSKVRARGVIVDVTALDVIDSFATRTLRDVAYMIRLRGAETVIVGIQPEVAFSMVKLGLTLEGVATSLDLEEGLAYLDRKAKSHEREVRAHR
jgi:rsbT antagonist protein RsbS